MKIIKQGKIRKGTDRIKKCSNCKTVFQYSSRDIIDLTVDGQSMFDGVQCPVCEELIATSFLDKKVKADADFRTRT